MRIKNPALRSSGADVLLRRKNEIRSKIRMLNIFVSYHHLDSDTANTNYETRKSYSDIAASIDIAVNNFSLNSAAQFRFCREPSRDAPGVKSIVRIAHRLPGAHCSALRSFKCGRNNSNVVAIMPQKAGA